ncbi:phenolphthiocerol/phthiocerol polyketide synthase subunit B-like [Patella vulgata]|uniref:phenolphthiocerol/phthiocerol polyketide synthase subunit B-like n=1 Tax=Patella vulgata TaxID=6465 RepID=UPI0024A8DFC3|nr:phenolphthiocerol/phthiocerol polyketide synthase subunit B-like [Patella vulgata]
MCEVAIIGAGCQFPGADNLDEFWRVLRNGENHVIEIPPNRWNLEAFYDPDPAVPGKTHVRRAGFVDGHDKWDFKFYGINEFEALKMDPQHKFVLDSTFMALENAGISKQKISGSNTGVYIGMFGSDYANLFAPAADESDNYTLTGTSNSIVAARVSYVFNLLGPSMKIDTACSSSLVAIHLACQALRSGECDMAIAGGVNSLMRPDIFIQLSRAGMVSPTGQCQAFSENADGYARGEGCGIIILKPLEQALKDNDPIWATIVTSVNHDGQTVTPITTPSPQQQESLLNIVFDRHRIDPESVDYIEAHGTGTKAGDPVEVTALGKFFQKDKHPKQRLIGSVKTNIGHLESGAGIAGLIKVLLMHKNQEIVPSLHFEKASENVPLDKYNLKVPTEVQPWPKNGNRYMRSCVNSFSFGGTNSHAIITTPVHPSNGPENYDTSISQEQ